MDRYADGDDGAFAVVYDVVAPRLTIYVRRQVRDDDRAADVLQQTFLHIHRARATFVRGSAVLPWSFAIARRLIIDQARHPSARARHESLERGDLVDPALGCEEQVRMKEAARRLAAALEEIPPRQREAFELTRQDGLSLKQAAGRLGTTVTAVKLRAHRAVAALRSALDRDSPR